jgi:hypothetical protein
MKTFKLFLFSIAIASFFISCDKTESESKQDTPCGTQLTSIHHASNFEDIKSDTTKGILTYNLVNDSAQMVYSWYDKNLCGDSEPKISWETYIYDTLSQAATIYFEVDWYVLLAYRIKATNPNQGPLPGMVNYKSEYTVGLTQVYSGMEGQMYTSTLIRFKSFGSKALDFAFFYRQLGSVHATIEYYPFK